MSNNNEDGKLIRYTLDINDPPVLTPEQQARLDRLADRPDEEIDFSDQPALTEEQLAQFVRANPNYKPTKTAISLRLDSDVLSWFKRSGKGWQSRVNAILRDEMLKAESG